MGAGILGTVATFPINRKVPSSDGAYSELQKQLGVEIDGERGKAYRLVQATNADAIAQRAKAYKYTSKSLFTVESADATGDVPCGVGLLAQDSLAAGDLFWVQIEGQVTLTDSGAGVSNNNLLEIADGAAGDVKTETTVRVAGVFYPFARAAAAAAADARFLAELLFRLA